MARAPFNLNASVTHAFLEGPVIRADLERRANNVAAQARTNASGNMLQIRSKRLLDGIRYTIDRDSYGLYAIIGTNAVNPRDDFEYPAWLDRTYEPWLSQALADAWDD